MTFTGRGLNHAKHRVPRAELPRWIQYLAQTSETFANQPITRIILPGTHDAATYGPGEFPTNVARFNWQCQNLNIYQQARIGVRYFDLRFRAEDDRSRYPYWPFHGEARKTGDLLAPPAGQLSDEDTITSQLRRFLDENPDEILILSCLCEPAGNPHWVKALSDGLGGPHRLIPSPEGSDGADASSRPAIPTLKEVLETTGRVIISGSVDVSSINSPEEEELVDRYLWRSTGGAFFDSLYDRQIWKSNDPLRIQASMERWIAANMTDEASEQRFFNAQCQLTPAANSAGDVFRGLFKKSMTISPVTLAPLMNAHVCKVLCESKYWIEHASVMTVDFADANICSAIAGMNLARLDAAMIWCVRCRSSPDRDPALTSERSRPIVSYDSSLRVTGEIFPRPGSTRTLQPVPRNPSCRFGMDLTAGGPRICLRSLEATWPEDDSCDTVRLALDPLEGPT